MGNIRNFVHLHNHTEYSYFDGMLRIGEMLDEAEKMNMQALAITDHGNMFGCIKFYKSCLERGIKPIIGCEVYIAKYSRFSKKKGIDEYPFHLVLLVKDFKGYQNLMTLVSLGYLEGFFNYPRIDKEILSKHSDGLIALSSCLNGEIPRLILEGKIEKACETASEYNEIFGRRNFYLELMKHGIEKQNIVNNELIKISKKLNIPVVATNNCHYLYMSDSEEHVILDCISRNRRLAVVEEYGDYNDQLYFTSSEDMLYIFAEIPESISNTIEIAEKCNLKLKLCGLKSHKYPEYELPVEFKSHHSYLEYLCNKGLKERYGNYTKNIEERLNCELEIIKNAGLSEYFLIIYDIIEFAKNKNIAVGPGRGSSVGSLVTYSLGITNVDPLKFGLIFERFINPERIFFPDIDMDFQEDRVDEIDEYIKNKYGRENVANIGIFNTMGIRTIIRNVGKILRITSRKIEEIIGTIPDEVDSMIGIEKKLRGKLDKNKKISRLINITGLLEGTIRCISLSESGIVISPDPLVLYTPLYKTMDGQIITQYDRMCLEEVGLVVIDILGLRALTIIQKTLQAIKENYNLSIDINNIPFDDKKTFELFQNADTKGIFQLDGDGIRNFLKRVKPQNLGEIMILFALYKPRTLQFIDEFIKRKNGIVPIEYEHPLMKEILGETYGIIVYQEQVMQTAVKLASFSMGKADLLRRAMAKRVKYSIEEYKTDFINGAEKNKIDSTIAEKIFHNLEENSPHAFNKSHLVAYAIITYQTAYLKANYPKEFISETESLENLIVQESNNRISKKSNLYENLQTKVFTCDEYVGKI